uniref:Uncharacterized protein n=1 Tax=Haptolina ericina TaxID=156174 RepID=A0A7S3C1L8_9EUKA
MMDDNTVIVIGDRVIGQPPVVVCSVPQAEQLADEQPVKVEPVAQGVPYEGIVQPIITSEHVQVAPVARAQKRTVEHTSLTRKTRPRRTVSVGFEIGSRVGAKGIQDRRQKWFFSTIKQRVSGGWLIAFDDGDEEARPEYSMKLEMDTEQRAMEFVCTHQQVAEMAAAEEQDAATIVAAEAEPVASSAAIDPIERTASMAAVAEDHHAATVAAAAAEPGDATAAIERASSLPKHIREKFEYMEKAPAGPKDVATLAQEALRAKLQTTPDGRPRAVFRAGCHAQCLTQVLGGVGTHDFRVANEDHILRDGHVLIRKGEFYLWGLADWNPWAPSFAGDTGMYMFWDLAAELKKTGQKSFHLFRHCTDNKLKMPPSAWHGKDAAKKALYLGMYTVDDECTQEMHYNDLAPVYTATQELLCEHDLKKGLGKSIEQIRQHHERKNESFTMQCVVPVGYDEKLYDELVRARANNGVVATDVDELGRL